MSNNIVFPLAYNTQHTHVYTALRNYIDSSNGYVYPLEDMCLDTGDFDDFVAEIEKVFGKINQFDYSRNANNVNIELVSDRIIGTVGGNIDSLYVEFKFKTEEDRYEAFQVYNMFLKEETSVQIFSYSYSMYGGELSDSVKIFDDSQLENISNSFYPYIDVPVMFDQFFMGSENILLLVGEPGLGKSKLSTAALKYALQNPDKIPYDKMADDPGLESQYISVAFVKSTEVLANDNFWRTMAQTTPDFCIIDDLDYMLTSRDAEVMSHDDMLKNAFLNQFLSYTDGVEKNKTKFIITTNQHYNEIDTAVLRKGRLFDILELRKLSSDEALEIWQEFGLDTKLFFKHFPEKHVLPAELGVMIDKQKNQRLDNPTASYLKESGISKVQRATKTKRIGL